MSDNKCAAPDQRTVVFRACLPAVLRPRDVALAVGVGERTVLAWIKSGQLPARRRGKFLLVSRSALLQFVEAEPIALRALGDDGGDR